MDECTIDSDDPDPPEDLQLDISLENLVLEELDGTLEQALQSYFVNYMAEETSTNTYQAIQESEENDFVISYTDPEEEGEYILDFPKSQYVELGEIKTDDYDISGAILSEKIKAMFVIIFNDREDLCFDDIVGHEKKIDLSFYFQNINQAH